MNIALAQARGPCKDILWHTLETSVRFRFDFGRYDLPQIEKPLVPLPIEKGNLNVRA